MSDHVEHVEINERGDVVIEFREDVYDSRPVLSPKEARALAHRITIALGICKCGPDRQARCRLCCCD